LTNSSKTSESKPSWLQRARTLPLQIQAPNTASQQAGAMKRVYCWIAAMKSGGWLKPPTRLMLLVVVVVVTDEVEVWTPLEVTETPEEDAAVVVAVTVVVAVLSATLVVIELAAVLVIVRVVVLGADTEEDPIRPHTAIIEVDIASSRSRLRGTPNLVNRRPERIAPPNDKYFCPNVRANPHQLVVNQRKAWIVRKEKSYLSCS
jgi:hypothetical protein